MGRDTVPARRLSSGKGCRQEHVQLSNRAPSARLWARAQWELRRRAPVPESGAQEASFPEEGRSESKLKEEYELPSPQLREGCQWNAGYSGAPVGGEGQFSRGIRDIL